MRLYEVVYILDAALDEAAASTKLEKFHELATVRGGEISAVDHWGPRQLAYPIKKASVGYYVVAHFTADAEALPEFERLLKLDGEVLRYLLIINEGQLCAHSCLMIGFSDFALTTFPIQPRSTAADAVFFKLQKDTQCRGACCLWEYTLC